MYAVIFRANINQFDENYALLAEKMRELAIREYGCLEFVSVRDGEREISISYWQTTQAIRQWKQNAKHLAAQALGRSKWYQSYSVQIVEIMRQYEENITK